MASAAAPAAPPAFRDACPLLRRRRGLRSGDSILVVKSVLCVSHPRGRSAGAVAAQWLLVPASVRPGLVREMPFPLIVACMFLFPSRLVIFDLLSERAILPCWALGVSVFL